MKSLVVQMAPRAAGPRIIELTVTEDTSIAEICAFTMRYVDPPSFSTSQRMAQSIVRTFAQVKDNCSESMGIA
jgi:hypothetical protein